MDRPPKPLAVALRERWRRRLPQALDVGESLLSRYGDPRRRYHDLAHLADVLDAVEILRHECRDLDALELAAWFHDAVYDVGADDNEAASADLARSLLAPYRSLPLREEVGRLVLLTRDHAVGPGDSDGAVLCDADLAVLARPPGEYDDYAARVREEYAAVPDAAFRAGRAAILRGLLRRAHVYSTPYGRQAWEEPARANLRRELRLLLP